MDALTDRIEKDLQATTFMPGASSEDRGTTGSRLILPESLSPDLVYAPEIANPITRKLGKRGFLYYDHLGTRIKDADVIARINKLAIPPAYQNVAIASNPQAHLQAIGWDVRGRKQYRYHPLWTEGRGQAKFSLLPEFGESLPLIRSRVDQDLRLRKPGPDKVIATVVWILDNLLIRVGNQTYARENGSFGVTTLRNRHVAIEGNEVRFQFRGKSGKEWRLSHKDRRITRTLRTLQELPGQQLFQYVDDDGSRRVVQSQDVNAYIREASGGEFSSRQFRTWGATCMAATALAALPDELTGRERLRQGNAVIDLVASKLVNTRAVCRSSYIHPLVLEQYEAGTLKDIMRLRLPRRAELVEWLDEDELRVLKWLKQNSSGEAQN
jgi:DNA topoisomerase-1